MNVSKVNKQVKHINVHQAPSSWYTGLYLSNFIGGSKFWLLKSTTVLMHRYIESRPPLRFLIAARGVRNFRGGVQPPQLPPPDKYSPGDTVKWCDFGTVLSYLLEWQCRAIVSCHRGMVGLQFVDVLSISTFDIIPSHSVWTSFVDDP